MKIEQLIVQYLYNNKQVTVQDIGTFTISPEVYIENESDKEAALPPGAISFEHNSRAVQDTGLLDFIMQQTRKIRPLASSDLESYSILTKQFLNIGKPLIIDGLGTLIKTQLGNYEFSQSNTSNARLEAAPGQIKEKQNEEISFSTVRNKKGSKKGFAAILLIVFIVIVGIAAYYFLKNPTKDNSLQKIDSVVRDTPTMQKPAAIPITDTVKTTMVDSTKNNLTDTTKMVITKNDGYTFKVVIKQYDTKDAAQKAYARLKNYGHTVILSTTDSVHYNLAIPFTTPISDTSRAKDSLNKFFQAKAFIDLN